MLPIIFFKEQKKKKAFFGDEFIQSSFETNQQNGYNISFHLEAQPKGSFYVSGETSKSGFAGLISVGYINGYEPVNGDKKISENPIIRGSLGYVCIKLSADKNGIRPYEDDEIQPYSCGEVVVSSFFGPLKEVYYHPVALFRQNGKVAQITNCDLSFTASKSGVLGFGGYKYYISAA